MDIVPYQAVDAQEVYRLRDLTFGTMHLEAALPWQPCQQVESVTRDGCKYVCRKGHQFLGYGAAYPVDTSHFRLNLLVTPQQARRGIGTRLFTHLEAALQSCGGQYLQARVLEALPASIHFVIARGFREIHRMRGMTLQARDFMPQPWAGLETQLAVQGFVVTTFHAEAVAQQQPIEKLARLQAAALQGWPSPDPTQPVEVSFAHLRTHFNSITQPTRIFIMKYGEVYVGYTSLHDGPGTAVHPAYRNRGIAKVLKVHAIQQGIREGQKRIATCSANLALQRVNMQLGYRFNGVTEVRFVKALAEGSRVAAT